MTPTGTPLLSHGVGCLTLALNQSTCYSCLRGRYWIASARCAGWIRSLPAKSAIVRRGHCPPPTRPACEMVWCGVRNERWRNSGTSPGNMPATGVGAGDVKRLGGGHARQDEGRERASSVLPDPGGPNIIFMFWTKTSNLQLCRPPDPAALGQKRGKKVCAISSCNTATVQHLHHERCLRLGAGAFRVISSFALLTIGPGFRRACC
jgi:hypothetical protein